MGPPPNYLITRKLVRHFFRKYLPQEPINKANVISELQESIIKNGIDHPNTLLAIDRVDQAEDDAKQYRAKLSTLRIQQRVMGTLRKPQYPYHEKGRFRDDLYVKDWTLYDGVK